MMKALIAGVDSSTQSCKVVVRNLESGAIVRTGRAPHPDGSEVDPEAWWRALLAAVADAGGFEDVAAVSIAGQQHGMVVLDAGGHVIRPALLWNDTRSAKAAADLVREVGAADFARRTGSVPVASFTITKLRWLVDHEPENAAKVAAIALPHDWLTWRLRGFGPAGGGCATQSPLGPVLTELTTDRSEASGTGYFNPATNSYDAELLSHALRRPNEGILLPRVLNPWEAQHVARETPSFGRDLVVGAGAGDNAAAALGLGIRTGDVVVSIGTSGTVFAVGNAPHGNAPHSLTPPGDETGTVAGFADAAGGYLPLVATLNAARVLDATARVLGVDHDELGRLALLAQPASDGLVLTPYFEGERTPNLPNATAKLTGMTLASTTRENLSRAAIEGMLCGLADGLDALRRGGAPVHRILLIGGAAQNAAVSHIAAQVFDLPITVPVPGEYVAGGAAVQAAWALTGTRPEWLVSVAATPTADHHPEIRTAYTSR